MPRELDEAGEQALRMRAKAELRERLRALRRVMPEAACAARSSALCERLIALPEFERARVVVGYAAFRKEASVETRAAARRKRRARRSGSCASSRRTRSACTATAAATR